MSGKPPRRSSDQVRRQRRTLSCLPCRLHKLRCDRVVPCQSCTRFEREDQCRLNPPPVAGLAYTGSQVSVLPKMGSESTSPAKAGFPPTPSIAAAECNDVPQCSPEVHKAPGRVIPPRSVLSHFHNTSREDTLEGVTVASAIVSRPYNVSDRTLLDVPASYWKRFLVSVLPSQTQCDMLVSYFFENINWIYQAIHAPSFRSDYNKFWATEIAEIDLIWLSLLFMMLCLGCVFIPSQMAEAVGFDPADLPLLSRRWYSASRQALHAGGYDSKPTLTQLQVFLISQLYWYSTNNVEVLNSHMGQAIRNAQAMELDKEAPPTMNCLEREMRHRIWWDLVSSDTFQSLCLGRCPLLQSHLSTVPFPSNCNDVDITCTSIRVCSISEITEMSVHHFRARLFKVLNKLYMDNGAHLSSYSFVAQIDAEVNKILEEFPWYLREDSDILRQHLSPRFVTVVTWMRHILHSCICIQRVRMYRSFLKPLVGDSWQICMEASISALSVYKSLRGPDIARFQRSQSMHVQAYQVFSAAVTLATFLLVEMPSNAGVIRADIELVIDDLHSHSKSVDKNRRIPLISEGRKVIRRILALYDARCRYALQEDFLQSRSVGGSSQLEEPPTALVPAISSVFGGESTAHRYLERCTIEYMINDSTPGEASAAANGLSSTALEMSAWDALIDPGQWNQWADLLWADLDPVIPMDDSL